MKIQIRGKSPDEVLLECDIEDSTPAENRTKVALERAVSARADLSGANLSGTCLYGADLAEVDLTGCERAPLIIARTRILPEGALIGWKKVFSPTGPGVAKLHIPANAPRFHAFGRKCRAAFVDVLEAPPGAYTEWYGRRTEYKIGERVIADSWDTNWRNECSHGIHFFITREEAEDYPAMTVLRRP